MIVVKKRYEVRDDGLRDGERGGERKLGRRLRSIRKWGRLTGKIQTALKN